MNFSLGHFLELILAGIFFGLVSFAFIELMKVFHKGSNRLSIWPPLKGFIGGGVLVFVAYFISTDYLGLGLDVIDFINSVVLLILKKGLGWIDIGIV